MAIGTPVTIGEGEGADFLTPVSMTTTAEVPAGAKIILACSWSTTTADISTIVNDGTDLDWTIDHVYVNASSPDYKQALISGNAPAGLASSTVITVTLDEQAFFRWLHGFYVTGLATTSYEDGTSTGGQGTTVATDTWITAGVTTTNADDLIVGAVFVDNHAVTGCVATSPYTELHEHVWGTSGTAQIVYRIVSSTGTYTPGGTFGTITPNNDPWTAAVVAYKAEAVVQDAPEKLRTVQSNLRH